MPILLLGEVAAAILDSAPDGILSIDESGRVSTVNSTAARMLGRSCDDIEGRNLIELLRPSVRGDGLAWLRDVQGQGGFADVCALRGDGLLASLQLAVRTTQLAGHLVFACYLREASGRRHGDPEGMVVARRNSPIAPCQSDAKPTKGVDPIVYLVGGEPSMRSSLDRMLRRCGWAVESFGAAHTFLSHAHPSVPGCAVLDVELPDLDGLSLQARLRADCASLPIIFVTGRGDVPTSVRAMKAGAFEFFTKPISEVALLTAIRDAVAISTSALKRASLARELDARYKSLTPRERDVMDGVVSGLLNKQVASELDISEITVKAHRGRVMRKMNVGSLAELVNLADILGLPSSEHMRRPKAFSFSSSMTVGR